MTRRFLYSLAMWLGAIVTASAFLAAKDETLEQLIIRAQAAQGGQQADLCVEVAERELKLTTDFYKDNKPEDGRVTLEKIVEFSDKAHSAAIKSSKRLPRTEIKIRKIVTRLRDLKRNVDVDEQDIVQKAVDQLEDFRTEILKAMFGVKSHD
jgi:hypothetical protein